jgi:hypothetical protein
MLRDLQFGHTLTSFTVYDSGLNISRKDMRHSPEGDVFEREATKDADRS